MMNPPESSNPKPKKFSVTFEICEGKTTGQVVSFDSVSSSITSSISSGALADHSSLSESSESLPHLPVHSSTSTSSSGLSASRTAKKPSKPCQCCSVLNYLKLHCLCGNGTLLFVRDISSSKEGVEVKDCVRHPEVCSDMDLTDPVIGNSSADVVSPVEESQDSLPFPRIRLSVRPECNISSAPPVEEEEYEPIPNWWNIPKMEHMMAFPDQLPVYHRPPMVPTHFMEDGRSSFLNLVWICRTFDAHDKGCEPPMGVTRVFHDPRTIPELPHEVHNLIDKLTDYDITQLMTKYDEIRHIYRKHSETDRVDVPQTENSTTDDFVEVSSELDSTDTRPEPYIDGDVSCINPNPETEGGPSEEVHAVREIEMGEGTSHVEEETLGCARDHVVGDANVTLVYAKFQKWYYPGVMQSSIEDWDNATQPITVHYYDGSPDKNLPPDMIFPLKRLPPGAKFQLQLDSSLYEDVYYMSFKPRLLDSGLLTATIEILSEDSPVRSVSFSATALSPKDVVQIRSALKSSFYPSKSRINFTELTPGSIIEFSSRRTRVQGVPKVEKTTAQKVPLKRKKVTAEKPSSSSENAPSPSKKRNIEVKSTHVLEPSTVNSTSSSPEDKLEPEWQYLCTAPGCELLFDTEQQLLAHRERIKKRKKKRHTTMQLVPKAVPKSTSIRKESRPTVNSAGPSTPGGSRCVRIQLPQHPRVPISDSETDPGSLCTSRWSRSVQGFGLRPEKCTLSDKVKSFRKLKGENKFKCPPQTDLFSGQHFILTKGPPQTFTKPRKRAVDSESESTDVENYYSTSLPFDVLKLQRALECGGGRIYSDFSEIPTDLRHNPGHSLIVVSSHPTRTANYIYGVALGCTIVRHDTIFDCVKKSMSLRDALTSGTAILLPPGWCDQKMTWAPPRASQVKPLNGQMFFIALKTNQESKYFWSSLILYLGGKSIVIEEQHQTFAMVDRTVNGIVADREIATSLACQANKRGVPIVNTAWIVQAVITGCRPLFSQYQVSVVQSEMSTGLSS